MSQLMQALQKLNFTSVLPKSKPVLVDKLAESAEYFCIDIKAGLAEPHLKPSFKFNGSYHHL